MRPGEGHRLIAIPEKCTDPGGIAIYLRIPRGRSRGKKLVINNTPSPSPSCSFFSGPRYINLFTLIVLLGA